MAIALGATNSADVGGTASPYTVAFDAGCATNGILFVGCATVLGSGVSEMTYGGQTMTAVATAVEASGDRRHSLFYLVNPPTGSQTLSVTFAGGFLRWCASSYTGVAQTSTLEQSGSETTGATAVSGRGETITATVNNDWMVLFAGAGNPITASTGATNRIILGGQNASAFFDSNGVIGTSAYTMNVTMGIGDHTFAGLWTAIKPYVAPSANGNFLNFM